jgi:hypothetical protein
VYYTGLNINTAFFGGVNLKNASGIQKSYGSWLAFFRYKNSRIAMKELTSII